MLTGTRPSWRTFFSSQNNSTGEVKPDNTPTPTQDPADAALSTAVPVPPGGTSAPAGVPAWLYVLIPLLAVLLGGLLFLWKKWKN